MIYLDGNCLEKLGHERIKAMNHIKYWDVIKVEEQHYRYLRSIENAEGIRFLGAQMMPDVNVTLDAVISPKSKLKYLSVGGFNMIFVTNEFFKIQNPNDIGFCGFNKLKFQINSSFGDSLKELFIFGHDTYQLPKFSNPNSLKEFAEMTTFYEPSLNGYNVVSYDLAFNSNNFESPSPIYSNLKVFISSVRITENSPKNHRQIEQLIDDLNKQPNLEEFHLWGLVVDVDVARRLKRLRPGIHLVVHDFQFDNGDKVVSKQLFKPFLKELRNCPGVVLGTNGIILSNTLNEYLANEANLAFFEKLKFETRTPTGGLLNFHSFRVKEY